MNSAAGGFPIVGIGCSAGGLEALEKFFTHVPAASGMAFVVVQHLSPLHRSALPELLRHYTEMPVVEVSDGLLVQPDVVYVIPPNRDLTLQQGALHLSDPLAAQGLRLPIDTFLRSLASDQRERAVGVLLSGMGSDGVLGLAAIKANGGLTLVQEPASAQADGMPTSAIQAGVASAVARPELMPAQLADALGLPFPAPVRPAVAEVQRALDQINQLLRESSGNDFSLYKSNTLLRRIERRMAVRQVGSMDDYALLLRGEPHELELLFKELLIGVTGFFRDAEVWNALRDEVLPAWLAQAPPGKTFRAWVAGCSTGEEAYTLAILFAEALAQLTPPARVSLQIYATDLDEAAIGVARKGVYPAAIAASVSAERLARHFTLEDGGGYRIARSLRETVVFAPQNLTVDPPFTRLDLLSCRNLLIYFGAPLQKQLLPLFHYALNPGGVLLLGNAESIGSFARLFTPVNQKARIFRRDAQPQPLSAHAFTTRGTASPVVPEPPPPPAELAENLGTLTDQLVQQTWAPAAVLVNADGDILYISGRTGKYLEPAAGKTNMNLHAMARDGLREALAGMIRKALKEPLPVELRGLRVGSNGGAQRVDVIVQALDRPDALRGRVIVVFKDVVMPKVRRRAGAKPGASPPTLLEAELQQAREALQVAHEEMQTAMEELRSSNEELQSTNEELQSTNEELTTSKEELQSLNEESQTVNAELQSKVDDLTWVKNDMANLLNSTDIATVFLDSRMKLRRYTTGAVKIFRLIPGDVGRPLSDLVSDLDHPALVDDAQQVLHTLVFKESEVATHDDRWYRVRVMPYRTQDNLIDGVVITFTDISAIKRLETELRHKQG